LSQFGELNRREAANTAILYAFDLIEHDGEDMRNLPFLDRKAALALSVTAGRRNSTATPAKNLQRKAPRSPDEALSPFNPISAPITGLPATRYRSPQPRNNNTASRYRTNPPLRSTL
jgi:hypothetical protein